MERSFAFMEAPASVNFRAMHPSGFEIQLTLRNEKMGELIANADKLIGTLINRGWQPVNHRGNDSEAPLCPTHGKPMKPSKHGGWYCPVRIAANDGTGKPVYCKQRVKE